MDLNFDLDGLEIALQTGNEAVLDSFSGRKHKKSVNIDYPDPVNDLDTSKLKTLMEEAVRRNIEPHEGKNLGILLSGGLDSSLVLFYTKIMFPDIKLTAFHLYYENPRTDELKYAQLIADKYDVPLEVVNVNHRNQILNMLEVTSMCTTMTMGIIPCYMGHDVAAEKGIDVMLHGTLGDEMFGAWKIDKRYYDRIVPIYPKVRSGSKFERAMALYFGTNKAWFCNNAFIDTAKNITLSDMELTGVYELMKEKKLWSTTKKWQIERMYGGKKVMDEPASIFGIETVYPFLDKELLEYCFGVVPEQVYNKGPMRMIMDMFYGMPKEVVNRGINWDVGTEGKVGLSPTDEFYTYDFLKHLLPTEEVQIEILNKYFPEHTKKSFRNWLNTCDRRGAQIALLMAYDRWLME